MAAQTTPLNGSWFTLEISTDSGTTYDKCGLARSISFEGSTAERDTSSSEDCGFSTFQPSRKDSSISFEGLVMYAEAAGYLRANDLEDLWNNRTFFDWKITYYDCDGASMTGEYEKTGKGFINSYSENASSEETITVSCGIKVSGAVTSTVIS